MTTFHDGPAHGKTLLLQRKPRFLRVVMNNAGAIDALDLLEDKPAVDETLHLYILEKDKGMIHIRASKGGGVYVMADYRYTSQQPTDAEMRSTSKFGAWVEANASKYPQPK